MGVDRGVFRGVVRGVATGDASTPNAVGLTTPLSAFTGLMLGWWFTDTCCTVKQTHATLSIY